jgi:hypothetical protein
MAEAASDRKIHVGQGELHGFLPIKEKRSGDQRADGCRRNKAPVSRDQEETERQMALKLIEAGKDPEQTKAFLNALSCLHHQQS